MKKTLYIILLVLFPSLIYSQITGVVVDNNTGKPIPYVNIWVENKDIGVSSDINGKSNLDTELIGSTLVLSSIGYEQKKVQCINQELRIQLKPIVVEISEIVVVGQLPKICCLGKVNDNMKDAFYCCTAPWIIGQTFPHKKKYKDTPFIKEVGLLTKSAIDSAIFQVRIYSLNEKGDIGDCLHKEPIYGLAKKGLKKTLVDLSQKSIKFSEHGIVVAVEWVIVDSNKHIYNFTSANTGEQELMTTYEPAISMNKGKTSLEMWEYNGSWKRKQDSKGIIQMELKLFNHQQ